VKRCYRAWTANKKAVLRPGQELSATRGKSGSYTRAGRWEERLITMLPQAAAERSRVARRGDGPGLRVRASLAPACRGSPARAPAVEGIANRPPASIASLQAAAVPTTGPPGSRVAGRQSALLVVAQLAQAGEPARQRKPVEPIALVSAAEPIRSLCLGSFNWTLVRACRRRVRAPMITV